MHVRVQRKLVSITRKLWFYLLFVLLQFIPPFTSKGGIITPFNLSKRTEITVDILQHALVSSLGVLYPIFKVIPIILVISIIFLGKRTARWFNAYVGILYVLFAFLQHIAVTEQYGLSILVTNFVSLLIVAAFWFWDVFAQKNDFTPKEQPMWKYWVVPLAFLAFWYPLNPSTAMPDFNPIYLLTNVAGLTFCMMTPIYLAILTLYYPRINLATLRVTGLVGIIIACYNVLMNFILYPSLLWWNGILHIPLLTISGHALSLKKSVINHHAHALFDEFRSKRIER